MEGTELYEVEVYLAPDGVILDMNCNCPYEWGPFCKHQAAVLYAIRADRGRNASVPETGTASKEPDLHQLLMAQSKETLAGLLLSQAQRDRNLRRGLLLRFGNPEDEIEQSRRLVKASMYTRDGFWEYGEVSKALQGAWTVLQRAEECVQADCERAVRLSLVVLAEAVDLLSQCDDSDGKVGEVLAACIGTVAEAMEAGCKQMPAEQRAGLFQLVLDEAQDVVYDGWEEYRLALLEALVICCEDAALRQALYEVLEHHQQLYTEGYGLYYREDMARIQLDIQLRWGEPEQAQRFMDAHIHLPSFRKRAIRQAMENGDPAGALSLALDGMKVDSDYAGLLRGWRIAAYQAYQAMGNEDKVLELAEEFLLHEPDGFAYYSVLKNGFPPEVWPQRREALLADFVARRRPSEGYVEILLEENDFDALLKYCERFPHVLPGLASKIPTEYKKDVSRIYRDYVLQYVSSASNRNQYKQVCDLLRRMGTDVDKQSMLDMAQELKSLYPRRPAFQDELSRIS